MPGDTRGTDLVSWWRNRSAYRHDIAQTIARLRELQTRLSAAAGSAQPATVAPSDSLEQLTQRAGQLLADIEEARIELPKHTTSMEADRKSLQNLVANVRASASQRVRDEAETAGRNRHLAAQAALKRKQNIKKISAAGIALAVLFVLYQY